MDIDRDDRAPRRRRRRSHRGHSTLGRLFGLATLLPLASRAPLYARLLWGLVLDGRVPMARKGILAAALGYLALGRDVIPDDVPVLGGLDDLVVVVLAVDLFLDGVEEVVIVERLAALGLDRAEFERDVASMRRLLPGPLRRLVRRLPELAGLAARALQASGIGPRLRAWITQEEGSLA